MSEPQWLDNFSQSSTAGMADSTFTDNLSRGGTFSKSLVFQAISNVVVIGHDIFALLLCQFFNLGPHPAKLLFGFFSFFGPNKPTGRKCCSGIMSNFFNFLNLFWHYYLIGNIQDHFGAIQTPSRHPQTPPDTQKFITYFGRKWATGRKQNTLK